MKTLEKNSGVLISNIHKKCVAIAGLFHDLGHGPYSHLWESFVNRNSSEDWAVCIFIYLFKVYTHFL